MKQKYTYPILFLFTFFLFPPSGFSEGSKQLNLSGANCLSSLSTSLYLCNNFTTHCSSSNGDRTQFATYDANGSCQPYERLYIEVLADEVVYIGFKGAPSNSLTDSIVYRIQSEDNFGNTAVVFGEHWLPENNEGFISNLQQACEGPTELIVPPATGGYDAIMWTPPAPGRYFIEFSQKKDVAPYAWSYNGFDIDLFDITVYNTVTSTVKPGRLYSKSWQFSEDSDFTGINYILSDDGIVTSVEFATMNGGTWVQFANQTGCGSSNWTESRKSIYNAQALFPQYKIFLNPPDADIFTIATTPGQIVPPAPVGNRFCDGHIEFVVNVDKPGDVDIELSFAPTTYATTTRHAAVVTGANTIYWDGKDGNGVDVPNNIPITFTVTYVNGLTNLPLYDVEGNTSGFTVQLYAPAGNPPFVFWDDEYIWAKPACTSGSGTGGGVNSLAVQSNVGTAGCGYTPPNPPVACHKWPSSICGWGNKNTVNTWWFTVSTSQTQPTINQWRAPLLPVFLTTTNAYCTNTSGHVFMVGTDLNTEVYHWSYNPPSPFVIITHANPSDAFITVEFLNGAPSGAIEVYGTNATCSGQGPTASFPVTVNPFPSPNLSGNSALCVGTSGVVYTTESGKTNYTWSVSPGGIVTAGGTAADNTVTVNWNTAGPQTVSVNYTDPVTGCRPTNPTIYNVTVNPRPSPTFLSGDLTACINTPGHNYFTETGKENYTWTISGGTITFGGGPNDDFAEVTWTVAGPGTISVNYTEPSTQCRAVNATNFAVTVYNWPSPTITSTATSVCQGIAGNVYTTQAGMSNYLWTVTGGTITAGGTGTDNSVTVTWNTVGTGHVEVNYTEPTTQCTAVTAFDFPVTVNGLPSPTLGGNLAVCKNSVGNVYTTEAGKLNYAWTVTGGTITAGGTGTDNSVTVTWTTVGNGQVSVNYANPGTLCVAASPMVADVTVNDLPTPTISSTAGTVCLGIPGNVYSTQAGKSNYTWTVTGGTITAGGTATDNSVTVTWNTAGTGHVTVNYTEPSTQCAAENPFDFPVTVNALPVISLTGFQSVCKDVPGNVYTTEAGKNNYIWNVTGGTVNGGGTGTDHTITITWTVVGTGQVSVNYTDANQCIAATPKALDVEVKPRPVPTITSTAGSVCQGVPGNVYTTESGKTGYGWTVTGGTITAGGTPTDNTVTVTWNLVGTGYVTVNWVEPVTQCNAATVTIYTVTVKPLPTPTVSSAASSVCLGVPGNVYTTEPGMDAYIWTFAGGTATSGGGAGDDFAVITWNSVGPHQVTVNYTDHGTQCTAATAAGFSVNVKDLPSPTLSGNLSVCRNVAGNIYTTEAGKTGYVWTVTGGIITAGGTAADNTITVTWDLVGTGHVSVNYTEPLTQCTAATAKVIDVEVKPVPVPVISGPLNACVNTPGNIYFTEAGKSNYTWNVIGGTYTFTGPGQDQIDVTWTSTGLHTISVNYMDVNQCYATNPTVINVNVTLLPTPAISGLATLCEGVTETYTTEGFMQNYTWVVSAGGTIQSGGTTSDNSVTVTWTTAGAQSVSVNYSLASGCTALNPTVKNITVNTRPTPAFSAGPVSVCKDVAGNVYTTEAGKNAYVWNVSGGTITAGGTATDNSITITWTTVGTGQVSVNYTDPLTNCAAVNPTVLSVEVKPVPVPVITGPVNACFNTPGNIYATEAGKSNYTWVVNGGTYTYPGPGQDQIDVTWSSTGPHSLTVNYMEANQCYATSPTNYSVTVHPLPAPTINGTNAICTGIATTYTTENFGQNYAWVISAGGSIQSGGTANDNSVTVVWNTPGAQSVSVNYALATGCFALNATNFPVSVNQSTAPVVSATANPVCEGSSSTYTTQLAMTNYVWSVPAGGAIQAGGGSGQNFVTVLWNTPNSQTITVYFTNQFGCTPPTPTPYAVNINPLPVTTINGLSSVCQDNPTPYPYQTTIIDPLVSYSWQILAGSGSITPSATDNPVNIAWAGTGTATLKVSATVNATGCSASRTLDVAVNPKPSVSLIPCFDTYTNRSAKRFLLKGANPPYPQPANPPQGEFLVSPSTPALQYDAVSGNYWFAPALVPGVTTQTFSISYRYTNRFGCPNTTSNAVQITVAGPNAGCGTSMTDPRDNKTYGTALLAGRCWMTENLNYRQGAAPNSIGTAMTDNCQPEKFCPPADPTCATKEGAFYQWDELVQYLNTDGPAYQGLCPPGWHVPTENEWQSLIDNVDPSFSAPTANGIVGAYLKDTYKNFLALMTGVNYLSNTWAFATGTLTNTMYWSSTPDGDSKAVARGLNDPYNPSISRYSSSRENAFPVRCVKD